MNIRIEKRDCITVIGKLGEGYANNSREWIPPLWKQASSSFNEIASLAIKDKDGSYKIWGAMSDVNQQFNRWGEKGLYMVACEVERNAKVPDKWVKWVIPSFTYVIVECEQSKSKETFNNILNNYFPENNLNLAGAVHEHYPAHLSDQHMELYFPIQKH